MSICSIARFVPIAASCLAAVSLSVPSPAMGQIPTALGNQIRQLNSAYGALQYNGHTPSAQQARLIAEGTQAISILEATTTGNPALRESVEVENADARRRAEAKLEEIVSVAEREYQREAQMRASAEAPKVICNQMTQTCYSPAVATTIYAVVLHMNNVWSPNLLTNNAQKTVDNAVIQRRVSSFLFNLVSKSNMNQELKNEILAMIKAWYDVAASWSSGPAAPDMYNHIDPRVGTAFKQTQEEIAKQTLARRVIGEALASYRIQEVLRKEAADVGDALRPSEAVCVNTIQADQANQIRGNARVYATNQGKKALEDGLGEKRSAARYVVDRYSKSRSLYCTPRDAANGVCSKSDLPAGDINAALLFSADPTDEGLTETYQDEKQLAAVESFSERISGLPFYAETLPVKCTTDACKAFEETRKLAKMIEMNVRHSYNYIIGRRASPKDIQNKADNKSAVTNGVKDKYAF